MNISISMRHSLRKYMLISAAILFFVSISAPIHAQTFIKTGNTVNYRSNNFEVATDAKGQDVPIKMNTWKIYEEANVDNKPEFIDHKALTPKEQSFFADVLFPVHSLSELPNGDYSITITNALIGPDGSLVYFTFSDFETKDSAVGLPLKNKITNEIKHALSTYPKMKPAMSGGKPVPCLLSHTGKKNIHVYYGVVDF